MPNRDMQILAIDSGGQAIIWSRINSNHPYNILVPLSRKSNEDIIGFVNND